MKYFELISQQLFNISIQDFTSIMLKTRYERMFHENKEDTEIVIESDSISSSSDVGGDNGRNSNNNFKSESSGNSGGSSGNSGSTDKTIRSNILKLINYISDLDIKGQNINYNEFNCIQRKVSVKKEIKKEDNSENSQCNNNDILTDDCDLKHKELKKLKNEEEEEEEEDYAKAKEDISNEEDIGKGFDEALNIKLKERSLLVYHIITGVTTKEESIRWVIFQNFIDQLLGFLYGGIGSLYFLSQCLAPCAANLN